MGDNVIRGGALSWRIQGIHDFVLKAIGDNYDRHSQNGAFVEAIGTYLLDENATHQQLAEILRGDIITAKEAGPLCFAVAEFGLIEYTKRPDVDLLQRQNMIYECALLFGC